jgi:putative PIN family toxin of toxin-antitoxin system
VRAVFDPNVLISALLSPSGAPARALAGWLSGEFELVVSETLLGELGEALGYPKLSKHVQRPEAADFIELLRGSARLGAEPPPGLHRSRDPDDDYLLALAEAERAVLVTGDADLLALSDDLPIVTPAAFLDSL